MNSPTCKQIHTQLLDYLEEEMPAVERERVAAHLAECNHCHKEYKGLRTMLNKTKNLPIEDPGEEFWRQLPYNVLAQVKAARQAAHPPNDNLLAKDNIIVNNNVADLTSRRASGSKHRSLDHHQNLKARGLTAGLAIAATVLLAVNVMTFSPKDVKGWFNQGEFQARIEASDLSDLAGSVANLTDADASARLGFIEQRRVDNAFRAGTTLAQIFAYVQAGRSSLALNSLQRLQEQLRNQQFPQQKPVSAVTLSSLRKAEEALQSAQPDREQVLSLLSGFQQDFENYLVHAAAQQLPLYRAGIWLFNAGLAVAAQDAAAVAAVAHPAQLDYLQNAFARSNAPPGVLHALRDFELTASRVTGGAEISGYDLRNLQRALASLRSLMG